jgi:hypothetical protein
MMRAAKMGDLHEVNALLARNVNADSTDEVYTRELFKAC